MNSRTTRKFREAFRNLPKQTRDQAKAAYRRFRDNPNHPGLQFKRVHSTRPIYSARVNVSYRVLGILDGDDIIWFWIGTHAEYDKLLRRL